MSVQMLPIRDQLTGSKAYDKGYDDKYGKYDKYDDKYDKPYDRSNDKYGKSYASRSPGAIAACSTVPSMKRSSSIFGPFPGLWSQVLLQYQATVNWAPSDAHC